MRASPSIVVFSHRASRSLITGSPFPLLSSGRSAARERRLRPSVQHPYRNRVENSLPPSFLLIDCGANLRPRENRPALRNYSVTGSLCRLFYRVKPILPPPPLSPRTPPG